MFCKVCGKELADRAIFCGNCGTKIEREAVVEKAEEVADTVAEAVAEEVTEAVDAVEEVVAETEAKIEEEVTAVFEDAEDKVQDVVEEAVAVAEEEVVAPVEETVETVADAVEEVADAAVAAVEDVTKTVEAAPAAEKTAFSEKISQLNNTADTTADYDAADIEKNKIMAVLAYIIFLIPLLAAKDSRFARFHTNQGLVLFISAIIFSIVAVIPIIGWIIAPIIGLLITVLAIIGIINALNGRTKELPIIGKFKILK